jgi:hypothetical protein
MALFVHYCSNQPFLIVLRNNLKIEKVFLLLFLCCLLYFHTTDSVLTRRSWRFNLHHHHFIKVYFNCFSQSNCYWKNKIMNYFSQNYAVICYHLEYSFCCNNLDYSEIRCFHLMSWKYLFWKFHYLELKIPY